MTALTDPTLNAVLKREHEAADAERAARRAASDTPDARADNPDFRFSDRMKTAYLAIRPDQGRFLYGQVVACEARTIVEFGSSFGISTLYLAAAAAQTGGHVIGTEYHESKAERARATLSDAGLDADIRVGDARETLSGPGANIDLLFLDGAKDLYLPILRLLEPRLAKGALIIADNIPTDRQVPFLTAIAEPASGYATSLIRFGKGGMSCSVRLSPV